jgi:hypothetical protein
MSKTIQIHNVPETVHRTLKVRAAMARMSLSEFVLNELREIAARPSMNALRERLHRRAPVHLEVSANRTVCQERGQRGRRATSTHPDE